MPPLLAAPAPVEWQAADDLQDPDDKAALAQHLQAVAEAGLPADSVHWRMRHAVGESRRWHSDLLGGYWPRGACSSQAIGFLLKQKQKQQPAARPPQRRSRQQ
jgi:hypothetical protein